ncbi:MAG TPA: hypothetical protein VKS01_07585, partial [Bryobacteraceae bacterium]|nr:hypothetical protein [Bryobacteraceae bacterium]
MIPSARRKLPGVAYYLAAPALAAILFHRAFHTWFLADDFAWLGLRFQVHRASDLQHVLFSPQAQGTIRFLSERLFFLVFFSLFGLNALPFRIFVFATWCADLTLAAIVGARLTGSRAAGLLAAILWTSSAALARPLAWASSYNEVMFALCVLMAFYARLRWIDDRRRRWIAIEWIAYLAGFGALELIVVYPALALLHAL